jgi:hypothetical protein
MTKPLDMTDTQILSWLEIRGRLTDDRIKFDKTSWYYKFDEAEITREDYLGEDVFSFKHIIVERQTLREAVCMAAAILKEKK